MVFPVFYEASGTSARNYPHEPTASKPCRPRVFLAPSILSARASLDTEAESPDGALSSTRVGGGDDRAVGPGRPAAGRDLEAARPRAEPAAHDRLDVAVERAGLGAACPRARDAALARAFAGDLALQ